MNSRQYFGSDFETQHATFKASGGQFLYTSQRGKMVTAAYRKKGNMVEVAVAHCNPKDEPDETIGKAIALQHFVNGNTIQIWARRSETDCRFAVSGLCDWVA